MNNEIQIHNHMRGKRFETILKGKLIDRGFKVLKLAIPETADLILLNRIPILIECKVSKSFVWYRKNNKQYEKLLKYLQDGYFVFIAIKFTTAPSIIKFFSLDDEYPYRIEEGITLNSFVAWCKTEGK